MKIKKQRHKKVCHKKKKLNFESYKNCLKAAQLDNKINHLEKNKIDIDPIPENHKEFIKTINQYQKRSKDLKVKCIMFLLKKLIRLI